MLRGILNQALWSPSSLFTQGQQGAWYDPSDLNTLFQDAAGTIPVTADGDPVGLMLDKSGNDNHASQSTTAAKPTYRTDGTLPWLEFDGVDDYLVSVPFSIPQPFTQIASLKDVNTSIGGASILGGATDIDSLLYRYGTDPTGTLSFYSGNRVAMGTYTDEKLIVSCLFNGAQSSGYYNGELKNTGDCGTDICTGCSIGARFSGSNPAEFQFTGLVKYEGADLIDKDSVEKYLAAKAGVTLP